MLTLSVLGPVDLRRDGVTLRVPGGKTAELLVRLALDPGTPVRAERLLEELWPEPRHEVSANTLQSKVSRLRRALSDPALLHGDAAGYTLYVDPAEVDALRVVRLVQEAAALRSSGDPVGAVRACDQGLGLFHGDVPSLTVPRQRTAAGTPPGRGNLPAGLPPIVGRGAVLDQVAEALRTHRPVTLTGPAGVGKTRLAVAAADRSAAPGGAWLVRLENAHDTTTVWQTVGAALGIDAPTRTGVLERLHGTELLLVLDNCEHVADAAAEVLPTLLAASAGVHVLATSQVPLRVDGERLLDVEPLDLQDSVLLFAERAAAQRPQPSDEATTRLVEGVCRAVDGLPLAIELAAARTKVLPVHEIARRLEDRFALLRDPTSDRPPRRTTLRAALSWSYDLLFPDDQRGLWALSVFTGGAPLPAVEAVLDALQVPPESAIDVVSRLVDRSLATADVPDHGQARYRLLDSVRELGREHLRDAGLLEVAAAAHAAWFAAAAGRASTGSRGAEQPEHVDLARTERANIDAAMAWCATHEPDQGVRIALGFGWTWVVLGTGVDGAHRIRAALAAAPSTTPADRAAALTLCGWFEAAGGDLTRAVSDIDQAIRTGDADARAVGQLHLAFVYTQGGQAAEALRLVEACRPALHESGLGWEEAASWLLAAWANIASGDVTAAAAACEQALTLFGPSNDRWALAHADAMLGELAQAERRYADATAHLDRAARAAGDLGFVAAQAHHLVNLGRAQHQSGDTAEGRTTLNRAIELGLRCGDTRTVAVARTRLAQVLRGLGETAPATALAQDAVEWFTTAGGGDGAHLATYLLAVLRSDARSPTGRDDLVAVLEGVRGVDPLVETLTLDALAAIDARAGDHTSALAELETADQVFAAEPRLWPGDRIDADAARRELASAW